MKNYRKAVIILLLTTMLAVLLPSLAPGVQLLAGADFQISPGVPSYDVAVTGQQPIPATYLTEYRPTYGPTPVRIDTGRPATVEAVQGYELPWNPPATPSPVPSGGAVPVQGYELPFRPIVTPSPVPSGGAVPVQGYELPFRPVSTPTPAPANLNLYRPVTTQGIIPNRAVTQPTPLPTFIPRNLPAGMRAGPGHNR